MRGDDGVSDRYYRDTLINVDLEAVHHNYKAIQGAHPGHTFIAVVKANSYGLGSTVVCDYLAERGVEFFAVATLDEAIELRMHGIKQKILVLGLINPKDINKAIQHRIAVTAPNLDWLEQARNHVTDKYDKEVWIHIKVNTSMNRYGISDIDEIKKMIETVNGFDRFIYEGIYSHLSSADEDNEVTDKHIREFKRIVDSVEPAEYIHIQNSAGSLKYKLDFCNTIRVGISLYGYYPSEYTKRISDIILKPSIQLLTHVADIHHLDEGDAVSYGGKYVAEGKETVATLPIGYADGFTRHHTGYKVGMESGESCPVVGAVCMDATMIKVPDDISVGDVVIIIQPDVASDQSLEAYSEYIGTISYEALTSLSRRIPRHYIGKDTDFTHNEILK